MLGEVLSQGMYFLSVVPSFIFVLLLIRLVTPKKDNTRRSLNSNSQALLKEIYADFPDYHGPDAESAIKTFLTEYINVCYGKQLGFKKSRISSKVDIPVYKYTMDDIRHLAFNGICISSYTKNNVYATVTYSCFLTFYTPRLSLKRRYDVDYTLQLTDSDTTNVTMKCPNCGGDYLSSADKCCPYCGTLVVRDTIMSWFITGITEIK